MVAPLVIELTLRSRRNPVPYLLAVAMASNIGSTATITGNPQNMMIGSFSRISYADFAAALAPVAFFGLMLTVVLIVLFHRREFADRALLPAPSTAIRFHRVPMWRALAGTAGRLLVSHGTTAGEGGDRCRRAAVVDPPREE